MSEHLSDEQRVEVREIFDHFDTNSDGRIQSSEFRGLLNALSGEVDEEECRLGLQILDADGNGTIEFQEFVVWWEGRL